jgi:alpha-amylase/alpha-mannosidase (GH57 family)
MPYLIIHGHFYQPPRENPWTEEIDREPTAAPFHNWNERINEECYRANAFARILADDGRVVDILNNYAYLSFNFGPTLLSWLRAQAPDVYERIREGDAASRVRLGHGNAIAQVYNHVIMPLANRRDKVTQVQWGLADFRFHFGREAEAMWLAETAVDEETLEVLVEAGLRFAILAPGQAARTRSGPLGNSHDRTWRDVGGRIDPSRAYLCRLPSGRSITLFFYDGPLAHAASFGDMLSNSHRMIEQIAGAMDGHRNHAQLIHFALDGETFGHHKKFGERTIIYAATHVAPRAGFILVNYAAYLDLAPPEWEVQIKPNTSWSCVHGVGRWSTDCGCNTGRVPGGHQRWRAPLRAALDHLRDSLAQIFEKYAPELLGDPWEARNAYGAVLPDRSPERIDAFLEARAGRRLSADERERALTLLEMQRHALFMYTSCGWFFDDIAGLETAQVLKYAARAIDLASRFDSNDLTRSFLKDLERAPGNEPAYRHGAEVYHKLVLPAAIRPERVAVSYAISALIKPFSLHGRRHAYRIEQTQSYARKIGAFSTVCGHIYLTSDFTGQQTGWAYAALHLGGYNFAASALLCNDPGEARKICALLDEQPKDVSISELMQVLKVSLGPTIYGLGDLPPADRRRLIKFLEQDVLAGLASSYQQIYTQHLGTIAALREANMPVPPELRLAAEYTLSHQLAQAAAELARHPDERAEQDMARVLDLAKRDGIHIERGEAAQALEQAVVQRFDDITRTSPRPEHLALYAQLSQLIAAADRLGFDARPARVQEKMLYFLREQAAKPYTSTLTSVWEAALKLAEQLRISPQAVTFKLDGK